jgi:hypothetical protein
LRFKDLLYADLDAGRVRSPKLVQMIIERGPISVTVRVLRKPPSRTRWKGARREKQYQGLAARVGHCAVSDSLSFELQASDINPAVALLVYSRIYFAIHSFIRINHGTIILFLVYDMVEAYGL